MSFSARFARNCVCGAIMSVFLSMPVITPSYRFSFLSFSDIHMLIVGVSDDAVDCMSRLLAAQDVRIRTLDSAKVSFLLSTARYIPQILTDHRHLLGMCFLQFDQLEKHSQRNGAVCSRTFIANGHVSQSSLFINQHQHQPHHTTPKQVVFRRV
jgi:hypothetical protein